MKKKLFRLEAINHQSNRLHGSVIVTPNYSILIYTLCVITFILATLVWLIKSEYSTKETVIGWLEPDSGLVKVFSTIQYGKVDEVLVQNGDVVQKGQSLLVVVRENMLNSEKSLEDTLLEEYNNQSEILLSQIPRLGKVYTYQREDIKQQIVASKVDLSKINCNYSAT